MFGHIATQKHCIRYFSNLRAYDMNLTIRSNKWNGHQSRLYCISVDASQGDTLESSALFLYIFYQNLLAKTHLTSYDLEWPNWEVMRLKLHVGHRVAPKISWNIGHASNRRFGMNGMCFFFRCLVMMRSHAFHRLMASVQVTEITFPRFPYLRSWWSYEVTKFHIRPLGPSEQLSVLAPSISIKFET